jgi:hypothetical protein
MKVKTKYILVALLVGAAILLFLFLFRNKENLIEYKIGTYDYLKPPFYVDTDGKLTNKWSETTIVEVGKTIDIVQNNPENTTDVRKDPKYYYFYAHVKEEEAIFFINNGFWPINGYVKERLQSESIVIPTDFIDPKTKQTMTKEALIKGALPNRIVYYQFIMNVDVNENPQPLAYRIFDGLEEPPSTPSNKSPPIERFAFLKPTLTSDENGNALPNKWSEDAHMKVNDFYKISGPESLLEGKPFNYWCYHATEEEALYLAENGHWPINSYVQEQLTNGKVELPYSLANDGYNLYGLVYGRTYPNRFLYMQYILDVESLEDPQPLAYKIYAGLEEPPKVGMYDFLKPTEVLMSDGSTKTKEWGQKTINKVADRLKRNKIPVPLDSSFLQEWFDFATEAEAVTFVQNGRWPINTYVQEKLNDDSFNFATMNDSDGKPTLTKEAIAEGIMFPNRLVYMKYIMPLESSENPKPLAFKVYMGTEKPPCPT